MPLPAPYYQTALGTLYHGDCLEVMRQLPDASVDAVVTDPPYELGFMGARWDKTGIAYNVAMWAEVLRVCKPGAHVLAFGGSRTYHRMACAIEDAGFEIRDQIQWVYGSGFPKSLDVSKALDKAAGAKRECIGPRVYGDGKPCHFVSKEAMTRSAGKCQSGRTTHGPSTAPATPLAVQWSGWGTALKPAHEPICLARKPLVGTVIENVLTHGTGALNIDAGRVACESTGRPHVIHKQHAKNTDGAHCYGDGLSGGSWQDPHPTVLGRWPANVIHDGSPEVVAGFPVTGGEKPRTLHHASKATTGARFFKADASESLTVADNGDSAARFFYTAKASTSDREAWNNHPTVKPKALIQHLVRLVLPPGGVVLDPFCGSGTLPVVAEALWVKWLAIEREAQWCDLAVRRLQQPKQRIMGG